MTIIIQVIIIIIIMLEFAPFVYTYCDLLIYIQSCIIKAGGKVTAFKLK